MNLFKFHYLILILPWMLMGNMLKDDSQPGNQESFQIVVDSSDYTLYQIRDTQDIPLYYFMDIDQYPCNNFVCERMQLRLYWDAFGNYIRFESRTGHDLTKINHTPFTGKDYMQLHALLNNPDSYIKQYKLADLTEKESEKVYYSTDAISGATIQNVSYETVKGAVKTCYTLWHLVHGDIVNQIRMITKESLDIQSPDHQTKMNTQKDSGLRDRIIRISQMAFVGDSLTEEELYSLLTMYSEESIYAPYVLELVRNANPGNKFYKELSLSIYQNYCLQEISIYNLLREKGYQNSTTRKYRIY